MASSPSALTPMHQMLEDLFGMDSHPWLKTFLGFLGWMWGTLSLSNTVLFCTLLLTVANLFFLLRDKWWRDSYKPKGRK